jgi:hypothetical protein
VQIPGATPNQRAYGGHGAAGIVGSDGDACAVLNAIHEIVEADDHCAALIAAIKSTHFPHPGNL